jgi:acyl-CoA synthetase (AMP-forming)/AMP-acid ligase II
LIEFLRESARREPTAVAVITAGEEITYADLLAKAEMIATGLAERGIERFGVVHQDAAVVIALLAGSSLVGAEACVYPPLDTNVARDTSNRFDHAVIVTDEHALDVDAEVVTPSDLAAAGGSPPSAPPAQRPLLVLTTGTTGEPRGARHDWARVLRPATRMRPAAGQRWLLAYGLHQFGGLQVLIHVAAAGATLVAPVPRRPREGLAAIRRYAVTHVSGTPTFWRFLLAEMRSDGEGVPRLKQVTIGGEAVPAGLLADIEETFPDARVSQIYGANEFGNTSVRDRRNGLPVAVLDNDDADVAFRIVEGELWVRSRVSMLGYYGHDPVADDWRPTGDLVEIVGDRIEFRGRSSDVINVGGVKVHPLPVEELISGVPGVQLCRVFGRGSAVTGAIVAVEVEAEESTDRVRLERAIREACATLPSPAQPRSIRFVDRIATRGSKIERRAN